MHLNDVTDSLVWLAVHFLGRGDYELALKYGFLNLDREMLNSKSHHVQYVHKSRA